MRAKKLRMEGKAKAAELDLAKENTDKTLRESIAIALITEEKTPLEAKEYMNTLLDI